MKYALLTLLSLVAMTGTAAAEVGEAHAFASAQGQTHWVDLCVLEDGTVILLVDGQQPGAPGVPDLPGLPGAPGIPAIPSVPSAPGVPDVPGGIPSAPGLPATPGVPGGIPAIPSLPSAPGLPPIPSLP